MTAGDLSVPEIAGGHRPPLQFKTARRTSDMMRTPYAARMGYLSVPDLLRPELSNWITTAGIYGSAGKSFV